MSITLHPHQASNADTLTQGIESFGCALDASDAGTGKTYTALQVARQLGVPVAVLCPKNIKTAWSRACEDMEVQSLFVETYEKIRRCSGEFTTITAVKGNITKRKKNNRKIMWTLPDIMKGHKKPLIVFDEGHKCKGRDSLNAKLLEASRRQHIQSLIISATPAGDPVEMKALGYALNLHSNPGQPKFWDWAKDHGVYEQWNGGWACHEDDKAEQMLTVYQAIKTRMVRTKLADLPHFPETVITVDAYDIGEGAIKKIYERADFTDSPSSAWHSVREQVEFAKLDFFRDSCLDAYEAGRSPIVFLNYRAPLIELHRQLNQEIPGGCGIVAGNQKDKHRQWYVDNFQDNTLRAMVCQSEAGGVSISLNDTRGTHPRETFISPGFSAVQLIQILGRTVRVNGIGKSIQHIIFASDTPEEGACKVLRMKSTNIRSLTDGDLTAGIL